MKADKDSGGIAPLTLNFGTRWRRVVSLKTQQLYFRGKNSRYPLTRRLDGPQKRSGRFEEQKNPSTRRNANRGQSSPRSLVIVPTTLSSLQYTQNTFGKNSETQAFVGSPNGGAPRSRHQTAITLHRHRLSSSRVGHNSLKPATWPLCEIQRLK